MSSLSGATSYRDTKTHFDIKAIESALEIYFFDLKSFPSTEQGLQVLLGKQMSRLPKDAWGNDYKYIYPSVYGNKKFDLYSFGKNGIDEHGQLDDISNWRGVDREFYPRKKQSIFYIAAICMVIVFVVIGWVIFSKRKKSLPNKAN